MAPSGRDAEDGDAEDGDGPTPEERPSSLRLSVPEMDCPSCAGKVERSVRTLEGIEAVDPRVMTGTVEVTYDEEQTTPGAIADRVEKAGYGVDGVPRDGGAGGDPTGPGPGADDGSTEGASATGDEASDADEARESVWRSPRAIKTWASGAVLAVGLLLEFFLPGWNALVATVLGRELFLADALFLVATALAGGVIFRNGYYSLRNRSLDIDLLMSIAIGGAVVAGLAFGESLYFEAATLAFLFGIAELLEAYSMDRARGSLRELMDLSPEEATVRRDGEPVTVPVEAVSIGEVVLVRPGEKIPLDGVVREGDSAVDQSPITGESIPVDKTPGDEVFAGTLNEGGYLEVEVTAAAGEDTLSRVIELVEQAGAARTDREQFVDRFAGYYTPAVVVFAVVVALVPPLLFGAPWVTYLVYGLTLLVLACPCAFVISTPVSVVSGITSAAKNGVLIKGGTHLEAMGEVGAVAMDKTGTITKGELTVTDVVPLGDNTEADVLRCARGLESRSEHPIGEAIVRRASDRGVGGRDVSSFEALTGEGVRADLDGTTHYAGKPSLFEELGFDLGHVHLATDGGVLTRKTRQICERNRCLDLIEDLIPDLQAEGKTVVLVGTEDRLEGVIAVADEVRPAAKRTVERLHELGIGRVVMLTGDNERTAGAIAEEVGVDEYRAELLPEQKVEAVRDLDDRYGGAAMVGDGVNDAPALAAATVGVAMGAAGTDAAIETADVALMSDDLRKLPYLYELSHDANGVIRQNVWASLGAKLLLALGVPFGLVPVWAAVLIGDAGMTTAVTGNALRLSRIRPEADPTAG